VFIKSNLGYTRDGEQRAAGPFLMLFGQKAGGPVRALVRYTKMRQCGHFMMASCEIRSPEARAETCTVSEHTKLQYPDFWRVRDGLYRVSLSGTYGADGLTIDADQYPGLWERLHPLPDELVAAFWQGGGHNSAGSEGPAIHRWARDNHRRLSRLAGPA
jgi:hypothetical protein